ncbi:MAG: hypothetical protein ACKPEY_05760 [Planctomycetota bacterium]
MGNLRKLRNLPKPPTSSRRRFLARSVQALAALLATETVSRLPNGTANGLPHCLAAPPSTPSPPASAADRRTFDLSAQQRQQFHQQVVVKVEAQGELKLNADGKKVIRKPLQVRADFQYEETLQRPATAQAAPPAAAPPAAQAKPPVALRYYDKATAEILINNKPFPARLADSHSLVALHLLDDQLTCVSPSGPLSRDELELLVHPGQSTLLAELLPATPVELNGEWPVTTTALAHLLNLDAVTTAQVAGKLTKVEGTTAFIQITGNVEGAVEGIATEIQIAAKLNVDLTHHCVTWLALGLKENRSIGHAEPGFETSSQIRVALRPSATPQRLTPQLLADLPLNFEPTQALLQFEATEAGYQALLDRRWHLMINRSDLTVLRWIDRGDLVAQCNLTRLPALAPGKQLSLDEFQDDIKASLAKNFRQFIEASQSQTGEGLRLLRVVAAGEASEIPMQWNYYHLSDEAGRRLALVCTFEASLAERFAENDRPLVSSIQLLDLNAAAAEPVSTQEPAPAKTSQ